MPKSLSSFLEDCRREIPNEVVHVEREVDPANHDVSAIIKHLGAARKYPLLVFDRPRNLHGRVSDFRLVMNFTISQRKTQIALGLPREMTRAQMAEACVDIERNRVAPVVVENRDAPVMENVRSGNAVDLYELPIMRHHYMDGGPYITLCTIAKDRRQGIYNASYHRMEIKSRNHTTHYHSQHHQWIIFRDYEDQGMECPVATVLGHHPAFYMGACYTGPFEVSEYDVIGAYLGEPLRVTPSKVEDYIPGEVLAHIPVDRTTYWS